jgi:hypothetical protein
LAKERLKEEKGKDEAHCSLAHLRDLGEEKRSEEKERVRVWRGLGAFLRRGGRTRV